jgi:hypothetical protein
VGVIYTIACHDCKVKQDMDKWYNFRPVDSRAEALKAFEDIGADGADFRAILAVSFLYKHNGHRISVMTDLDDDESTNGYTEPVDFWRDA